MERLLHHLEAIDKENNYTVLVPSSALNIWTPRAANFMVRPTDFPAYSWREQIGLAVRLRRLKGDLVHFTMPQQPLLYGGRSVTTVHDATLLKVYNPDKSWIVFRMKQLVGWFAFWVITRKSAEIVTVSDYTKRDLMKLLRVRPEKLHVIYEAADLPTAEVTPVDLPFESFLLYVGRQPEYKNIRRLAAAHQALLTSHPDLGLVLVGSLNSATEQNREYFAAQNFRNIHFAGFASDAELAWLYKNCAAYVFPSLMEGFGLPGLEAMRHGAPVVSSNATCLPEIYGEGALYFDPSDVDDMTKAIRSVLESAELRATLIDAGHARAEQFSWRKMATETLELYGRAVSPRTGDDADP